MTSDGASASWSGGDAVLLVLVGQFGSYRGPLAIVLAIPLGLTGALAALALTGVAFNVSSFSARSS